MLNKWFKIVALLLFCAALHAVPAGALPRGAGGASGGSGDLPFTALTTKFISPSGNDANPGTSGSPWASPNHAMNCGDVIIAAAGTYSTEWATWGTVSNCPSTSGGIDGTGGVYTATVLCAGPDLTSCPHTGMRINASNWAVEGFKASKTTGDGFCFLADASATSSTRYGYIAFINDIATNCLTGFATADGGHPSGSPGNGIGEWAVMGSIAQNANQEGLCIGAIDDAGPANFDSFSGTVVYYSGNFAINNQAPSCTGLADVEGLFWDTFDAHGFTGKSVMENNISFNNGGIGFAVFMQATVSSTLSMTFNHNTSFHNLACLQAATAGAVFGDQNFNLTGGFPWTISVQNSLLQGDLSTVGCGSGGWIYGLQVGGTVGSTSFSSSGNLIRGITGACHLGPVCDAGNNERAGDGYALGSDSYGTASFTNTSDLLTNWIGAPNCTGKADVASCMGWNNGSQTATSLTPIADLVATAGAAAGKGYQPPGPCAANSLYPTWVKGIVYLQWNSGSSTITEKAGLVNKPCSM